MEIGRFSSAVVARSLAMVSAAGGQLILTRLVLMHLGDEALAAWSLVWQTMVLLSLLDLGLGQAIVRLGTERRFDPRFWASVHALLWTAGVIHAVTMGMVAWFGTQSLGLSPDISRQFQHLCLLIGLAGLLRFRLGLGQWLLYAKPDPRPAAVIDLALSFSRPALCIGACLLGGNLLAMGFAAVACELSVFLTAYLLAERRPSSRPSLPHVKEILSCGGSMTLVAVLTSANIYLAGYVIGIHLGHQGVNLYQSSTMAGLLYIRFALMPQSVLFPRLVLEVHERGAATMIATYRRFIIPYLVLCAGAGALIIPLNDLFVELWVGSRFAAGPAFTAAHVLWIWLMIGRTLQQTALSAIVRNQWPIVVVHGVELTIIAVLAGPMLSRFGLVAFPLLQAGVHLLPILCHALHLRLVLRKPT